MAVCSACDAVNLPAVAPDFVLAAYVGVGSSHHGLHLPVVKETAVTRRGDVWRLGRHKLICGDAHSQEDVTALMGTERADMVFTDPPYNVPIDGHVCGLGSVRHRDFAFASGEMSEAQFRGWESADEQIHIHVLTARLYVRDPNRCDCHLLVAINES